MSNNTTFKQCILQKNNSTQVVWIPYKFAQINKILKIKEEDGWKVVWVSKRTSTYDEVSELSQEHKHQRKASDI